MKLVHIDGMMFEAEDRLKTLLDEPIDERLTLRHDARLAKRVEAAQRAIAKARDEFAAIVTGG